MSHRLFETLLVAALFLLVFYLLKTKPSQSAIHPDSAQKIEAATASSPRETKTSQQVEPSSAAATPSVAIATPIVPEHIETKTPTEAPGSKNKYPRRNLNLPKPNSISDLLNHLTKFERPRLLNSSAFDGSINSEFRGYYKSGKSYLRLVFERYINLEGGEKINLTIETQPNVFKRWTTQEGDIRLRNFQGDPYSLVMRLPDGIIFYIKFVLMHPIQRREARDIRQVRALSGWVLPIPQTTSFPAALLDVGAGWREGLGPGIDKTQVDIAPPEVMASLFPAALSKDSLK